MPLSFDPDWWTDATISPTFGTAVFDIASAGQPAGSVGDTIVLFGVFMAATTRPVITAADMIDSSLNEFPMTILSQSDASGLDAATAVAAIGPRPPDLELIRLLFTPDSGPGIFAIGNFPPDTLGKVVVEHEYPYVERLAETITAPRSGILAGMMVSDTNPGIDVTPTGAGGYEEAYVASTTDDYDAVVWAYESGAADATFDLTGNWITYDIILGQAGGWTVGAAGWGP